VRVGGHWGAGWTCGGSRGRVSTRVHPSAHVSCQSNSCLSGVSVEHPTEMQSPVHLFRLGEPLRVGWGDGMRPAEPRRTLGCHDLCVFAERESPGPRVCCASAVVLGLGAGSQTLVRVHPGRGPAQTHGYHGFWSGNTESWDGSETHHARCQICKHAQPQVQSLHATGRHPGDVLTYCHRETPGRRFDILQPLPTARDHAKAKTILKPMGWDIETIRIQHMIPWVPGIESMSIPRLPGRLGFFRPHVCQRKVRCW
jgi:hypothetical protein